MKYEAAVNGKPARLELDGARISYQREMGKPVEFGYSITDTGSGQWSVLVNGRSYDVRLLAQGEVGVNGQVLRVEILDPRSMRGRRRAAGTEGRQAVTAPMPGRVIRVLAETGQEVAAGQGLIVVEAMKMQNEMKSPKSGHVVEVKSAAGDTVTAGQILMVVD